MEFSLKKWQKMREKAAKTKKFSPAEKLVNFLSEMNMFCNG